MNFFTSTVPMVQEAQSVTEHAHILSIISKVRELTAKAKEKAKELEDRLMLHQGYFDASEAVTQAQKGKKDARSAVMAENPDIYDLSVAVKQLRSDLNQSRTELSDLLINYEKTSGNRSIETEDGVLVSIRQTATIQLKLF